MIGLFSGLQRPDKVFGRLTPEQQQDLAPKATVPTRAEAGAPPAPKDESLSGLGDVSVGDINMDTILGMGKDAAKKVGGAIAGGAGMAFDSLKGALTGSDPDKSAMLEGLAQGSVQDYADAAGIFLGKKPKARRFVSPTTLAAKRQVAQDVKDQRKFQQSMLDRLMDIQAGK